MSKFSNIWVFYYSKKQKAARLKAGDTLKSFFKNIEYTECGGIHTRICNFDDMKKIGEGSRKYVTYSR